MSLWIRNQDKDGLIKCDHFEIETFELKPPSSTGDIKTHKIICPTRARINKFREENDIELIEIDLRREDVPTYAIIRYKDIQRHYEYRIRTFQCVLGTYSTKEKALEVLDVIQEHIEHNGRTRDYRTFQMPQDNEV